MLDDTIMKEMTNLNIKNDEANRHYQQEEVEYSGAEDYEYEIQQQQPMSLEQQKAELKRKLQMISTKGKTQK